MSPTGGYLKGRLARRVRSPQLGRGVCPTITGGFDSFSRGRYAHPEQDRSITPREAARLQGFDDSFRFLGNRADIRRMIGNAVPPPLATAAGFAIRRSLERAAPVDLVPEQRSAVV
ncbi:MAG: DNA cytosine methyltransferase [Paracoccaceae bacterium]